MRRAALLSKEAIAADEFAQVPEFQPSPARQIEHLLAALNVKHQPGKLLLGRF